MTMKRFRPRTRAPRRATQWWLNQSVGSNVPTTGSNVLIDLLSGLESALGYNLNNVTVIRNVGRFQVYDAAAHSAGDYADLAWGLFVGSSELDNNDLAGDDFAAGDFMYLSGGRFSSVPSGGAGQTYLPHEGFSWDIRSARRLNDLGKTLWFFARGEAVSGTPNIHVTNRALVKLP